MGNGDKSMLVEPLADEHLPNGDVLMNHDEICGGADAPLILLDIETEHRRPDAPP